MRRVALVSAVALLAILAALLAFWRSPRSPMAVRPTALTYRAPPTATNPKLAALAREIPADAISPIANALNSPHGDIHHDLEILNAVFVAWQTNFPIEGNPVGENSEITAALAGANRLHFAFVAPNHPAINANGELCDRWGTPFRFHQLSGTEMEIRSAGPDRKFGTADDVEFAPWPKPL